MQKQFSTIVVTIIITAVVVGSVVYLWQEPKGQILISPSDLPQSSTPTPSPTKQNVKPTWKIEETQGKSTYRNNGLIVTFSKKWTADTTYPQGITHTAAITNGEAHILFGVGGHDFPFDLKKEFIQLGGGNKIVKLVDPVTKAIFALYYPTKTGGDLEMRGNISQEIEKEFIEIIRSIKYE